jgi:hypothetical protein
MMLPDRFVVLLMMSLAVSFAPRPAGAQVTSDGDAPVVTPFTPTLPALRFDLPPSPIERVDLPQAPVPVVVEYSDGYRVRNKIHRVASFATLPLFGAEVYLGQKMFNNPAAATAGERHWHGTIAIAITSLFGVNSVTGLWNLREARQDPHGRSRRTLHAVLMLIGDAGFAATALDHPSGRRFATDPAHKTQHLVLAYSSISVSTVGYLVMLFR